MSKKKIKVQGLQIHIEAGNQSEYISITDIAKKSNNKRPERVIQNWLKNISTVKYLFTWEKIHNPTLKHPQMGGVLEFVLDNSNYMSPKKWIKLTNAIGIYTKAGRGGGTYAHKDIAFNFLYWLSPEFQIYFIKEFQRLKEEESNHKQLKWDIEKITDNIDEIRNILDTIEGQSPNRNRMRLTTSEEE